MCLNENFRVSLEKNASLRFIKPVNIKFQKTNYEICLYAKEDLIQSYVIDQKPQFTKNAVFFLKSVLQKAIRRGLESYALHACFELFKLDYMVVYRRLPIIIIEDVCLHTGFETLVWFMMANIPPSKKMIEWTLGLVNYLCTCSKTWSYDMYETIPNDLPQTQLVWCLIYRIEFGGMRGDLGIIRCLVTNICNDPNFIIQSCEIKPHDLTNIQMPTVPMYDAIDFHVLPSILQLKCRFSSRDIKQMMWQNSSSINFRKTSQQINLEGWKEIMHDIRSVQIKYYNSLHA